MIRKQNRLICHLPNKYIQTIQTDRLRMSIMFCSLFLFICEINLYIILLSFITIRECGAVMHSVASVCLSVCLCPVRALIFESLDLWTSFFACRNTFRIPRSISYIKVIGSRSRSREQKSQKSVAKYTYSWVVCLRLKDNFVEYTTMQSCRNC